MFSIRICYCKNREFFFIFLAIDTMAIAFVIGAILILAHLAFEQISLGFKN